MEFPILFCSQDIHIHIHIPVIYHFSYSEKFLSIQCKLGVYLTRALRGRVIVVCLCVCVCVCVCVFSLIFIFIEFLRVLKTSFIMLRPYTHI